MNRPMDPAAERHQTVVIGAGQSGLAAAYHLQQRGIDFVVLESSNRVGDGWRARYDSLRLYSPARYDSLPGLRVPLPKRAYPTGRQMGDYLEAYVAHHKLPVRTGTVVDGLEAADDGYLITAGERRFHAEQVVLAGGFFRRPRVPEFAADLDPAIRQFHSSEYHQPSQLADGPVLVVGLSHSGADLALESVTHGHPTTISGRSHGQLPFSVDSRIGILSWPLLRFLVSHLLTVRTPVGRKMATRIRAGGAPLLRVRQQELSEAGVDLTEARTTGVKDGRPMLDDGRVLDVANVLWCTGFGPEFDWIKLPILGDDGWPDQQRGVVRSAPGIYMLGVPFQYGFTSMLVLGAARDAGHVVEQIARSASAGASPALPAAERA